MISISDLNDIPALSKSVQPLVEKIVENVRASGLQDYTFILVIEAGDTEAAVVRELGWNPLHDPINGIRFDEAGFEPYWCWLSKEGNWYRLIHTVGNDGFAYEILIEAAGDGPFHVMCREV